MLVFLRAILLKHTFNRRNYDIYNHLAEQKTQLKTTLSALVLCSLSSTAMADAIERSAIQFIGPLSDDMQLKPYQTEHRDAIIANLVPSLQK